MSGRGEPSGQPLFHLLVAKNPTGFNVGVAFGDLLTDRELVLHLVQCRVIR